MKTEMQEFMDALKARTPGEPEFHQAVEEVIETVWDTYQANPKYKANKILEKMVEPERVIMFRVPWIDDKGEVQINRGYRVQFNSAIGPYKGGIRFHPAVTLGTLKFLGFEQTFKNSLTTLPMGGGKGGSDFNPKGKSDNEVMRFCQSFMTELCKYIGPDTDVPAGDLGVGGREVGYMFGQYKRIRNEFTGVLTGKPFEFGGSRVRPESTGYGTVYLAQHVLASKGEKIAGKVVAISGFGNVAWGAAQKLVQLGAKVITVSGPDGYIYDEKGLDQEKINYLLELRASNNDVVEPYAKKFGARFKAGKKPWEVKCDIAFPCAIQNELNGEDAKQLVANGCRLIVETSNMGCTPEAIHYANEHITFVPGKAANAGGVATSCLEMSQNAMHYSWPAEEVDAKLSQIMKDIHDTCLKYGREGDKVNYVKGANIGGFIKVAEAMCAQGHV
ncbi:MULTISPECIES: NADP-specific glutamate dehydrogenase [Sanguibacteroides]|uniref:Glutamate dehydrogenase n=1 Tax=Sanguibacteroides justesenii TaxID=1547597 RepID=A0A0C3RFG9_9PORP|nr:MULTISPECIES: NADP-specific glutamate dehydrogenase [Sanguibacteroides]KIO43989.1 glutamate dehydrogenase [Sanguibacteroides justesenii]KIO47350.1 glutamate dehydrogenase [Sanguibacteroides justesenii]